MWRRAAQMREYNQLSRCADAGSDSVVGLCGRSRRLVQYASTRSACGVVRRCGKRARATFSVLQSVTLLATLFVVSLCVGSWLAPSKAVAGETGVSAGNSVRPPTSAPGAAKAGTPGANGNLSGAHPENVGRVEAREAQKAERAKQTGNLVGHGGPIKAVAVDAQGARVATGSFDYALMIWDVAGETPKVLHRFDQHDGAVNAVAFVPGTSQVLAAGDDGALSVWDITTGQRVHRFAGHTAKINHVAVSPDGRFAVTSSWDRTARVWDLSTMSAGPILEGHGGPVNAAQFSQDGAHIYTAAYDGVLRLFNRADGKLERPIYKHGWGLNVLARVPESEQIVAGALNGSVIVVDGVRGEVVKELAAFERPVLSMAIVDKPGLLAVGAGDGSVRVVRLADWENIETYQNPFGPVWALAFTPDATALYYSGLDDFVTRWQIEPRAPYEAVESPYPRRFQVSGNPDDPVAQGALQFARKCSVCHTLKPDGKNRAGPTLYKLFGRRIASLPEYPYSKGLEKLDIVWTEETVSKLFELGPENFTPGSKMPLQKMTDPQQRAALIAFLKSATEPGQDHGAAMGGGKGHVEKRSDNSAGSRNGPTDTKE